MRSTNVLAPIKNSTTTVRPICVRIKPFKYCRLSPDIGGGCVVEVIGANGFIAAFPPAAPGAGAMDCIPWEPGIFCGIWGIS